MFKPAFASLNSASLLLAAMLIAGCSRQSLQPTPIDDFSLDLTVESQPVVVGPATLLVELRGPAGGPVEAAAVSARGDMTHAGMMPSLGEGEPLGEGRYRIPIEWTMGGDWQVTVSVVLPDGQRIERTFDLSVSSGG